MHQGDATWAHLKNEMSATTAAAQTGWGADAGLVPMRLSNVQQEEREASPAGATGPGMSWLQALALAVTQGAYAVGRNQDTADLGTPDRTM